MKRLLITTFVSVSLLLASCGSNDQSDKKPSNDGNTAANSATTDSLPDSSSNNHNANRADQSGIDTTKQR